MGWNWAAWSVAGAEDLSSATALEFWIRSSAGSPSLTLSLADSSGASSAALPLSSYLPGGVSTSWQKVSVPMSAISGVNKAQLWEFNLSIGGAASGTATFYVDDIVFLKPCPAPPSPTATWTAAGSPTYSPSSTATRTPSPSATPSF